MFGFPHFLSICKYYTAGEDFYSVTTDYKNKNNKNRLSNKCNLPLKLRGLSKFSPSN